MSPLLQYCGPTPESNWVIPGVLLVGAYPASDDDEDTFELITSILKQGVSKFVCLQSEVSAVFVCLFCLLPRRRTSSVEVTFASSQHGKVPRDAPRCLD